MVLRLLEKYKNDIVPKMAEKFGFKNIYEVPRLVKIVINVGLGEAAHDKKVLDGVMRDIAEITGQKPAFTKARKAIAGFKIRKGSLIGCKVTLRRARMYEFLDRLINVALPRIRDFRGVSADSFDESGNYSLGITEQGIFPEIEIDKIQMVHGMDIAIVTTAKNRTEAFELLNLFGMPFKKVT
ncbi:MAG: 50S ribosomal protein L5 [Candidatus Omnitrophota bacterium]|nr:MAG: 50S ribosomal protein L5 [Candidatus Omnitrophota bacterium]